MIPVTAFDARKIALFGLGASGVAALEALRAGGAIVSAWDDDALARARIAERGIEPCDLREADFSAFDALVLSPGVPLTHPEPHWTVVRARAAGVEIIGDTELLFRQLRHLHSTAKVVAITGTNGKSTTTALLGHVLKAAGRDVRIGGNIGAPVLALDPPGSRTVFVLEFSSYQIDLTPGLHGTVAILLNITPDHLDRHGTFARYAAIKARIFDHQGNGDCAILCIDDGEAKKLAPKLARGPADFVPVTASGPVRQGTGVEHGEVVAVHDDVRHVVADITGARALRGQHNWQNAASAAAAVRALGLGDREIAAGLNSFPGLVHRMEPVATWKNVEFINDSKGTNAEAAARALASFEHIFWIAGGRAKAGGIDTLNNFFPKIEKAYLIGEAAADFAATLTPEVETVQCGTLDRAVADAARDAAASGLRDAVVLLSPACASFDQYPRFEARGEDFRRLVSRLEGVSMNREAGAQ